MGPSASLLFLFLTKQKRPKDETTTFSFPLAPINLRSTVIVFVFKCNFHFENGREICVFEYVVEGCFVPWDNVELWMVNINDVEMEETYHLAYSYCTRYRNAFLLFLVLLEMNRSSNSSQPARTWIRDSYFGAVVMFSPLRSCAFLFSFW